VYFNVNFNVFFKLTEVHLLVSELYIYQNARCNDTKILKNQDRLTIYPSAIISSAIKGNAMTSSHSF